VLSFVKGCFSISCIDPFFLICFCFEPSWWSFFYCIFLKNYNTVAHIQQNSSFKRNTITTFCKTSKITEMKFYRLRLDQHVKVLCWQALQVGSLIFSFICVFWRTVLVPTCQGNGLCSSRIEKILQSDRLQVILQL